MCSHNASLKFLILSLMIIWLSFFVCLMMLGSEIGGTMPTYTVKQGENWVQLAAKLQVPLQNLLNLNPDIRALRPGTGLRVPRVPPSAAGGSPPRVNIPPPPRHGGGPSPTGVGRGFVPLQGQGPPKPPGGKGGGGGGGQLPIPPRYTPPPGKPFRPYQPEGGGKGAPPAPYLKPYAPRELQGLPPRPTPYPFQRREQALSAPGPFQPPAPAPAAQYYAPQYGGGYGATANLRAFPGARATATVTPRTRRLRYGAAGQWAAGLGAGVGGAVQQFTRAFGAGVAGGARALNQVPPEGAFTPQGFARGAAASGPRV